jgi:large subunit ribosomal protein L34e
MVRPSLRSGKRKLFKTISGNYVYRKVTKKPNYAKCGTCDLKLPGTPRGTRTEIRKMSKSQRSPSRPFGGQFCSPCTRRKMINAVRSSQ